MKFSVYILQCSDKTYYVGCTNNLAKRLSEHNTSKKGAHYTKIRRPVVLKYSEQFLTLLEARRREKEIKSWRRGKKEKLWKKSIVDECFWCGICCRLFLVNLTEEEYKSGKYKTQFEEFGFINDFRKAAACGANTLRQKKDGNCIYIKANRCSIHEIRPQVCREFFCNSKLKKFGKMIEQIEKNRAGL